MALKLNLTSALIFVSFISISDATSRKQDVNSAQDHSRNIPVAEDSLYFDKFDEEEDGSLLILSTSQVQHSTPLQRVAMNGSRDEATKLARLLLSVAEREMEGCDLVVAVDDAYADPAIVREVLKLPNPKQVLTVRGISDLLSVAWVSGRCSGYLMLFGDPAPLIEFGDKHLNKWDYAGRYFFVLPSKLDFQAFADSVKGKKSERLAAAIKSNRTPEWTIYINQLFGSWEVTKVATWWHTAFTAEVRLYPDKLSDLKGVMLKCVTFEWKPSVFYYRSKNGTVLFRYGIDIGVVQTLSNVLNFTVQFEEPPAEEYWGREEQNGSWSGMMGKLARNEVDLGVVDLYVTIIRVNILDYTAPYDSELSCFMARTEPPLPRWQALAFPFQGTTWLAIIIGFVVSGPVLFLLAWGSARCGGEKISLQSLPSSWYYSFGIHCNENQTFWPIGESTRIFVVVLWLYSMTLTIAYSTNLMAFLTVSKPPASMETIRELHATGIEVSGLGKFYGDALASASDPYLKSLAFRFQDYNKDEVIIGKVLRGESVMLQNRPYLEFVAKTRFIDHGVPRLRLMKECFAPFNIAMALQRHSPLKRKFDQVIGWMINGGLIRHFFLNSLRLAASVKAREDEEAKAKGEFQGEQDSLAASQTNDGVIPISLDHLQSIFFIYIAGCVFSAFFFLAEVRMCRQVHKKSG